MVSGCPRDRGRVTPRAPRVGSRVAPAAAMESSFQRLGRGRRFRKKPADEAAAAPPTDGATAPAAATAPRHPGFVTAGEGTARAGDTASPANPATAAAPATPAARAPRDERPSSPKGTARHRADEYNAEPSRPVPGSTRPGLYGQTLVSFGLSDADDLFGGGVPLGSVVLIGADAHDDSGRRDCGNASTLVRYFLAEGVASNHAALWMPPSEVSRRTSGASGRSRAATLPRQTVRRAFDDDDDDDASKSKRKETRKEGSDDDGLRIAWQYRRYLRQGKALDDSRGGARGVGGLAAGVSATGGTLNSEGPETMTPRGSETSKHAGGVRRLPSMCHAFDLTREVGSETARTADLRCAPFERGRDARRPRSLADAARAAAATPDEARDDDDWERRALAECVRMVERCDAALLESGADEDSAPVGRVALQIPDVFPRDASSAASEAAAARLARFLRALRGLLRGGGGGGTALATQKWKRVCAVVTYPLSSVSPAAAAALAHAADAAIELETLPERRATETDAHAVEALLPDPNLCVALLRVRKLAFPGPGAVAPSPLTRMDRAYALQVRRRRMAVRPLRLAPEDAASGADGKKEKKAATTPSCGGGPADAPNALDF